MASLSTRVSLQWPPQDSFENTDTLVLTTPGNHFVDIRLLKGSTSKDKFPIDWVITGVEYAIPGTSKIQFRHEISSHVPNNHGGPWTDIGEFEKLANGDRKETGEMLNPETNIDQPYVEIWRSLDPLRSTEDRYFREEEGSSLEVEYACLKVKTEGYLGSLVRVGNFLQGALLNIESNEISVIRRYLKQTHWTTVFQFGNECSSIPTGIGEGNTIKLGSVIWELIESSLTK